MSKIVVLIESEERRGKGEPGDPIRRVKTYWELDGTLVFEKDEWEARGRPEAHEPNCMCPSCCAACGLK